MLEFVGPAGALLLDVEAPLLAIDDEAMDGFVNVDDGGGNQQVIHKDMLAKMSSKKIALSVGDKVKDKSANWSQPSEIIEIRGTDALVKHPGPNERTDLIPLDWLEKVSVRTGAFSELQEGVLSPDPSLNIQKTVEAKRNNTDGYPGQGVDYTEPSDLNFLV